MFLVCRITDEGFVVVAKFLLSLHNNLIFLCCKELVRVLLFTMSNESSYLYFLPDAMVPGFTLLLQPLPTCSLFSLKCCITSIFFYLSRVIGDCLT